MKKTYITPQTHAIVLTESDAVLAATSDMRMSNEAAGREYEVLSRRDGLDDMWD